MTVAGRASARPVRARLDNGLTVVARRNRAARSVAVRLSFEAGSAFDPPSLAGTAALTAHLLDRGAGTLTAEAIAERFDFLGVSYSARARRDSLDLEARLLVEHLREVLERLRLLVAEPTFPEPEVRRAKEQMLTTIAERDQDTSAVAEEALDAAFYPEGHPYHASVLGTLESVARIARSDLVGLHGRRLGPSGAVLALCGDVDPAEAHDLVDAAFASWPAGGPGERRTSIPEAPPLSRSRVVVRPIEGKTQADIALGVPPGIRRNSPDLPAALVLNNALGEFGLGGRLGEAIRETGGLAYYAHSYFEAGIGSGPLVVRCGVAPDRVLRALGIIRRTMSALRRRGPRRSEIDDARQALASAVPRRLETNRGCAAFLAECEFHGLGIDYPERLPGLIRAVDRAAVEAAAAKYMSLERHALAVAGPDIKEESLR